MAACFLTGYLLVSHLSSLLSFCHRRGVHLSQPSPALFDCHPAVKFVWGKERGFLDPKVCVCMCKAVGAKEGAWRLRHCDICSFVISLEWCSNYCHWGARSCVWGSAIEQRVLSMGKHSGRVWENARSLEGLLCSVSVLITHQLCEQRSCCNNYSKFSEYI